MFCPSPLARAESSNCLLPMYTEYGDAPTSSWLDELLPETQILSPCAELLPVAALLFQPLLISDADVAGLAAPAAGEWGVNLGEWAHAEAASSMTIADAFDTVLPSDAWIQWKLQANVTPESCSRIRAITVQVHALEEAGVVQAHVAPAPADNSVLGFKSLAVLDPLRFNQAFRAIASQYARRSKSTAPLRKPTEVFMKTMRFCGVTARRGTRGPSATDPDRRDFLYSYFYDFVAGKEDYNRRKLCPCGYSKEARETASKRKGEFIETFPTGKRTKLSGLP